MRGMNLAYRLVVTAIGLLPITVCTDAVAQSFSKTTIDTSWLADLVGNSCLDASMINVHACEPIKALYDAVRPVPPSNRAVVDAESVIQLCVAHKIKDVVCGEAALVEFRYSKVPCWEQNKC